MTGNGSRPKQAAILLTGATGFLGGYLLKELLERSEAPVYCLVRADSPDQARHRLMENAGFLFGDEAVAGWPWHRIRPLSGDLGRERFGLSPERHQELAWEVGSIFHVAAMLWHFGKLEHFMRVNVQSVEQLLTFCGEGREKTINHISTLAVSGRRRDNPENRFDEADFHEHLECPNVYVKTKHEAEKRLRPALLAGRRLRIFRPGFIMGDSRTGRFKKSITADAQYLHLQGHIFMRVAPPLHQDDFMDVTPVDYAAAAIAHIALADDTPPGVYHICNPQPILKARIWEFIRDYGFPARVIPPERYMDEILDGDDELFLRGLQSVIVYLDDYEKSPAIFDSEKTRRRLAGSGICCPPPDAVLLRRYLDYCVETGFLPSPEEMRRRDGAAT
ncbi:MAG: thioester reductase domain-containing protein [Desulfobulbaceae bacterium]|jgi:thioester reductase-like protein|nr:thioester reductase domain-containing protein [Desulfobulbaceae bacterium]